MRSSCLAAVSCLPPVPAAGQTGYLYYTIKPVRRQQARCKLFVALCLLHIISYHAANFCRGVLFCAVLNDGFHDICHVPDFVLSYNGDICFLIDCCAHRNKSPFHGIEKVNHNKEAQRTAAGAAPREFHPSDGLPKPCPSPATLLTLGLWLQGSTIIPFAHPRPQAATLHYGESVCRSAYPPGYGSWRTHRTARRKRDVSFVLYDAIVVILRAYLSRNSQSDLQKGESACPAVGSIYPKSEDLRYELGFQPPSQFFVHTEMGIAVFVV